MNLFLNVFEVVGVKCEIDSTLKEVSHPLIHIEKFETQHDIQNSRKFI